MHAACMHARELLNLMHARARLASCMQALGSMSRDARAGNKHVSLPPSLLNLDVLNTLSYVTHKGGGVRYEKTLPPGKEKKLTWRKALGVTLSHTSLHELVGLVAQPFFSYIPNITERSLVSGTQQEV